MSYIKGPPEVVFAKLETNLSFLNRRLLGAYRSGLLKSSQIAAIYLKQEAPVQTENDNKKQGRLEESFETIPPGASNSAQVISTAPHAKVVSQGVDSSDSGWEIPSQPTGVSFEATVDDLRDVQTPPNDPSLSNSDVDIPEGVSEGDTVFYPQVKVRKRNSNNYTRRAVRETTKRSNGTEVKLNPVLEAFKEEIEEVLRESGFTESQV
jgi:hypothetical protein